MKLLQFDVAERRSTEPVLTDPMDTLHATSNSALVGEETVSRYLVYGEDERQRRTKYTVLPWHQPTESSRRNRAGRVAVVN